MPSTYSPNLRIELIGYGEQNNTWGTTTNTNLGTLIEQAIAGRAVVNVTAGNVTLTAVDGATDQSRQMILGVTGTPGVARTIIAPSVSKVYVVANGSNATVTVKTASGTGVTVSASKAKFLYCDGVDFYDANSDQAGTFSSLIVSAASSTDALRVTQTGSGNALVVEDSANPDSTPFVINTDGRVIIGNTITRSIGGDSTPFLIDGVDYPGSSPAFVCNVNNANPVLLTLGKTRSATAGGVTIVQSGDNVGRIDFRGADGTALIQAAAITAAVDGTPGTNDMPGRLGFSTTRDGASVPTEAIRINSLQNVLFGRSYAGNERIGIGGGTSSITTTTSAGGILNDAIVSSAQTATYAANNTYLSTQAASFTLNVMAHYRASLFSIGAGSSITTQYGFFADGSLVGATNNFGFYSSIASGSGRYNFYAAGTADNFFEGNVKTNGTLAGGYSALSAGTTAMALASDNVVKVTPNATATYTTTVAPAGAMASIIIVTSGTTSYTITFGTGFLTTGTLATGTVTAKTFVISFVSDGTTMIETSRTVAM